MKPETKIKKIMESNENNDVKILKLYGVGLQFGNQYLASTIIELVKKLKGKQENERNTI